MPDKDIMAEIKKREAALPADVLLPIEQDGSEGFAGAMQRLSGGWRDLADLYDRAKLKGAVTTYVIPLRHAAAELEKVLKNLENSRPTSSHDAAIPDTELPPAPCPAVDLGHGHGAHSWVSGPFDARSRCGGHIDTAHPRQGLDALIAERTEAAQAETVTRIGPVEITVDEGMPHGRVVGPVELVSNSAVEPETFPGQVTDDEVTAYLKGDTQTIPRFDNPGKSIMGITPMGGLKLSSAFASSDIAAVQADLKRAHEAAMVDRVTVTPSIGVDKIMITDSAKVRGMMLSTPVTRLALDAADAFAAAEAEYVANSTIAAAAALMLDSNGGVHDPDNRNYRSIDQSIDIRIDPRMPDPVEVQYDLIDRKYLPTDQAAEIPFNIPKTWESPTMTADGYRVHGAPADPNIPPVPLLGQAGFGNGSYSPTYVPPGGIPLSYAELMTPVPAAILPAHLSHSQIGTVGQCPTKYRAQRLERTNGTASVVEVPEWAQIGGRVFHAAAEVIEQIVKIGDPDPLHDLGFDSAEDAWAHYWAAEIERVEQSSPVPRAMWRASAKGAEGETWWNANGPEMIKRYLAARPDEYTWNAPAVDFQAFLPAIELEYTVQVPTGYGPVPYRAILDRVTQHTDPASNWLTVTIRDYKTGKMPDDTQQLGEYAQVLRLRGVPERVKILGTYFNARKGVWTVPVDLEAEGWTAEWFTYHVTSGYAERLALTTGPTAARPSSFCGGCTVRWACPVKGVKR